MITGEVGLNEVGVAFDDLADPERHCKILVVPNAVGCLVCESPSGR